MSTCLVLAPLYSKAIIYKRMGPVILQEHHTRQNTAKQNPRWENLIALCTCDVIVNAVVIMGYVALASCQTSRHLFSVVALKAFEAACAVCILVAVALTSLQ